MSRLNIAVAGAGYIGLAHIGVLQKSACCTLSAIVDPAPAAAAIAAQAGVPLFPSLEDLFNSMRPDGVIIATPNQLHIAHALTCLKADTPMLLEKPIAPTVAEGELLVKRAAAAKARILIGHHRAHSPIMAKARQIIEQGALGKLVAVMGSATFFKPDDYFTAAPWRREPGGGPILINMIHEVHNLRMLCGEITAVQAFSSSATRGFAVEDTVAINLRFANGALGSFMLSDTAACPRSWEQTSQENPAYSSYPDEDCYVIAGTNGSLSVPSMRLKTYPQGARSLLVENLLRWSVVGLMQDDPLKHRVSILPL
ncbi:MAG: Gfo/Idh/MocA family oxidoreductase [Gammaproteobacteria bacterium]